MIDTYYIKGSTNIDPHECFTTKDTYPNFQSELSGFKNQLKKLVDNNESKTFFKFGDGDFRFLRGESLGTAAVGVRAISKNYADIKHEEFVKGAHLCDYYACELYPKNRAMFNEVIDRKIDYPAEFGYGLIASKWLTSMLSKDIGIIGAKEKVDLIERMMQYKEYQEYLGLEKFTDYIHIPQKFACDDIDATEQQVAKQLTQSKSKIFLLGVGHVKSGLLHRLKKHKKAIFLDIGSGIDALAGIIDPERPYMGGWTNHRIREFDYSSLDILQYDIWNTPHKLIG